MNPSIKIMLSKATLVLSVLLIMENVDSTNAQYSWQRKQQALSSTVSSLQSASGCAIEVNVEPCRCEPRTDSKNVSIICSNGTENDILDVILRINEEGIVLLSSLRIQNVPINRLPGSFVISAAVTSIFVNNCNITEVAPDAFYTLDNHLIHLQMVFNGLPEVPRQALSKLRVLQYLYLQNNHIKQLNSNDFSGLFSLVHLNLHGNRIVNIASDAFNNKYLTSVILGSNLLTKIPKFNDERAIPALKELVLSDNKIEQVGVLDLQNLGSSLTELKLDQNKITVLKNNFLKNMVKLDSLDVEGNAIYRIDNDAFAGVEKTLNWLVLADNQLKEIPTEALENIKNMTGLNLAKNQISTIKSDAFRKFGRSLKYLNLGNNRISGIDPRAFDKLDNLQSLHLNQNKMEITSLHTFESILDTIRLIDIHGNPLYCDCRMRWFALIASGNIKCRAVEKSNSTSKPSSNRVRSYGCENKESMIIDDDSVLPRCDSEWVNRMRKMSLTGADQIVQMASKTKCIWPRRLGDVPVTVMLANGAKTSIIEGSSSAPNTKILHQSLIFATSLINVALLSIFL